eukprot:snap_masked-scaffold_15-processed-gene-4.27-mRNA-1 protein AED:1.00 eAED:1.00 QI:0/-1/0/0/-1/1/1/0/1426
MQNDNPKEEYLQALFRKHTYPMQTPQPFVQQNLLKTGVKDSKFQETKVREGIKLYRKKLEGSDILFLEKYIFNGHQFLIKLELANNRMGVEGAKVFARLLEKNRSNIDFLDLTKNFLGNEGIEVISKALETNTRLKALLIGDNSVTDEGVEPVARMLKKNATLKSLEFHKNAYSGASLQPLADAVNMNKSLKVIMIGDPSTIRSRLEFVRYMIQSEKYVDEESDRTKVVLVYSKDRDNIILKAILKHWRTSKQQGRELYYIEREMLDRFDRFNRMDDKKMEKLYKTVIQRLAMHTKQGSVQALIAKIAVFGAEKSGKTSLIDSLIANRTLLQENSKKSAHSVVIKNWTHKGIRATIWDFSGKDQYFLANSYFVTPRAVVMICVDATKYDETEESYQKLVQYYIDSVNANAPGSRFIILLTQIDKLSRNYSDKLADKSPIDKVVEAMAKKKKKHISRSFHQHERKHCQSLAAEITRLGGNPVFPAKMGSNLRSVRSLQNYEDEAGAAFENMFSSVNEGEVNQGEEGGENDESQPLMRMKSIKNQLPRTNVIQEDALEVEVQDTLSKKKKKRPSYAAEPFNSNNLDFTSLGQSAAIRRPSKKETHVKWMPKVLNAMREKRCKELQLRLTRRPNLENIVLSSAKKLYNFRALKNAIKQTMKSPETASNPSLKVHIEKPAALLFGRLSEKNMMMLPQYDNELQATLYKENKDTIENILKADPSVAKHRPQLLKFSQEPKKQDNVSDGNKDPKKNSKRGKFKLGKLLGKKKKQDAVKALGVSEQKLKIENIPGLGDMGPIEVGEYRPVYTVNSLYHLIVSPEPGSDLRSRLIGRLQPGSRLFKSKDELFVVLETLHQIGYLLWFSGHSSLKNVVFAEPEWVVSMISTVLDPHILQGLEDNLQPEEKEAFKRFKEEGKLDINLLCSVGAWKGTSNVDKYHLINLMESFNLICPAAKTEGTEKSPVEYFIPAFLQNASINNPLLGGPSEQSNNWKRMKKLKKKILFDIRSIPAYVAKVMKENLNDSFKTKPTGTGVSSTNLGLSNRLRAIAASQSNTVPAHVQWRYEFDEFMPDGLLERLITLCNPILMFHDMFKPLPDIFAGVTGVDFLFVAHIETSDKREEKVGEEDPYVSMKTQSEEGRLAGSLVLTVVATEAWLGTTESAEFNPSDMWQVFNTMTYLTENLLAEFSGISYEVIVSLYNEELGTINLPRENLEQHLYSGMTGVKNVHRRSRKMKIPVHGHKIPLHHLVPPLFQYPDPGDAIPSAKDKFTEPVLPRVSELCYIMNTLDLINAQLGILPQNRFKAHILQKAVNKVIDQMLVLLADWYEPEMKNTDDPENFSGAMIRDREANLKILSDAGVTEVTRLKPAIRQFNDAEVQAFMDQLVGSNNPVISNVDVQTVQEMLDVASGIFKILMQKKIQKDNKKERTLLG